MTTPSKAVRVHTSYLDTLRKRYGEHLSDGELVQMALVELTSTPKEAAKPLGEEDPVEIEPGAEPLVVVEEESPVEPVGSALGDTEKALREYFDSQWRYKSSGSIGAPMFEAWLNPPPPYGFSVWHSKLPSMRTWYFRPGLIDHFKKIAKDWHGFTLVIGKAATEPARSAAARGVPYVPGDVEVYFVVSDVAVALGTLAKRTDVPFPLKVDFLRYADSDLYASVVDTYARNYACYYWTEKPWGTEEDEP